MFLKHNNYYVKFFLKIIGLIFLLLTVSCANTEKPKIALMVRTLDVEIFQRQKDYFINKVTEMGGNPIVVSAENNDQTQLKQAEELINSGVKVLIVFPLNMYTSAAIVRSAHKKNVKVISYDRLIMNAELDFYVAHNNIMLGELSASHMVSKKPEGEYMLICGDKMDRNAQLIYNGYMNVLNKSVQQNKIKICYKTFVESWDKNEALHEFKMYYQLTGELPSAVLCSSDAFALPIIDYIATIKKDQKVLVSGANMFLQSCKYILNDKQESSIFKSFKSLIEDAVVIAFQFLNNEKPKFELTTFNGRSEIPTILLPVYSLDKSNLEAIILKERYFTKEQLYN